MTIMKNKKAQDSRNTFYMISYYNTNLYKPYQFYKPCDEYLFHFFIVNNLALRKVSVIDVTLMSNEICRWSCVAYFIIFFVYGSYKLDYDKQENLQHAIQLICVYSKNAR